MANCRATSYGSLKVELMVPVSPSWSVTAASAASTVKRVRPADHVQVVDLAALLAQPQPLGEEEEVELAALGGLREVHERVELDVAAGGGVAPHGGVVHAGEVRGQDGSACGLDRVDPVSRRLSGWRSGWRAGAGRAARAACRPRSRCGTAPRRCSSGTSCSGDGGQVVRQRARAAAGSRRARPAASSSEQVGQLAPACRRRSRASEPYSAPSSSSSRVLARRGRVGVVVQEHHQVGEDLQRSPRPAGRSARRRTSATISARAARRRAG